MPYETAIPPIDNVIGICVIGVFGLAIWLHAKFYLAKYGIEISRSGQPDGLPFGGFGSDHGGCSDGGGHASCGDGGH